MTTIMDALEVAESERDEARRAAEVQTAEIAKLQAQVASYRDQVARLIVDGEASEVAAKAMIENARTIAGENAALMVQIKKLADTIDNAVEQSNGAAAAALDGSREIEQTRALLGRAVAALQDIRGLTEATRGDEKSTLSTIFHVSRAILADATATQAAAAWQAQREERGPAFRVIVSNAANAVKALVLIEARETVFEGVSPDSEWCAYCSKHVSQHFGDREYRCLERTDEQIAIVAAELARRGGGGK